jgi:hypothetical protein
MASNEARDRKIKDWYRKISAGEIMLPRFQRPESWDIWRIQNFLRTIIHDLPVGVCLILETGGKKIFHSRYLKTAPETSATVTEYLLDGQQRLTAMWRVLNNNYEGETFYLYLPEFDQTEDKFSSDELEVFAVRRHQTGGRRYPMWADEAAKCLKKGLIPIHFIRPDSIEERKKEWIEEAIVEFKPENVTDEDYHVKLKHYYELREKVSLRLSKIANIVSHYNLPFLSLGSDTPKDVALQVFINMNTNSKPLTLYDIIVAEVEQAKGEDLPGMIVSLLKKNPRLKRYGDVSKYILATSALLQGKTPSERGMIEMDKVIMLDNWNLMSNGLTSLVDLLVLENIIDDQRLPTVAIIPVCAAVYAKYNPKGDLGGYVNALLKRYIWLAFFTDRYESSVNTNTYYDYQYILKCIERVKNGESTESAESSIPIFDSEKHPLAAQKSLLTAAWPSYRSVLGRGVLAISLKLGARDFADGREVSEHNIKDRHYHHIYPDALLKESGIKSYLALNCALITDVTNWNIGRKDPVKYLKDRYELASENEVIDRLNSHAIPSSGIEMREYNMLSEQDRQLAIKEDFEKFLLKRADVISSLIQALVEGKAITPSMVELHD